MLEATSEVRYAPPRTVAEVWATYDFLAYPTPARLAQAYHRESLLTEALRGQVGLLRIWVRPPWGHQAAL